uniref:SPIN-DOC-like zinc-finger domain-containing protein n=1 Tax=Monopterus albus TaxID=43700 RepID=A0A3Q3JPD4_MONAL
MASSRGAKRKIDQENRVFQVRWETDYLFIDFKGKPMCLVCLEILSVMKDFNISRHYNILHKVKYAKYTTAARAAIVADLKSKVQKQRYLFFTRATTTQESALNASDAVALELAKAKKPLSDGKLIKRRAIEMAKAFGDDNLVKNFEVVSLSRHMVIHRVFDIHDHIEGKMKQVMHDCKYFSLALELTDVTDVSQLLIFTRTVDSSFKVHEELLKLVSLHDTTRGTDIFNAVNNVASEYGGFDKLSAVVTDGAPAMQGETHQICRAPSTEGSELPYTVKCNLHLSPQEALCARTLDFIHVMDLVTKITNLIHGGNRSLSHRRFIAFLDEVDAGKHQTVCELYVHMTTFQHKLELFKEGFSSRFLNLTHFPACEEMQKNVPKCEELLHKYKADIEKLQNEFKHHFQDFHDAATNGALRGPPLCCCQQATLRIQGTMRRRIHFGNWYQSPVYPPHPHPPSDFALSMISMFGSTYICESSFSTMKHIKSKERNRLTGDTLFHLMQIGCREFDIDIQSILRINSVIIFVSSIFLKYI